MFGHITTATESLDDEFAFNFDEEGDATGGTDFDFSAEAEDELYTSDQDVDALESFIDLDISEELNTFKTAGETSDNLYHLASVFKTHGISPSLVAFYDKDKLLSSASTMFPGIESVGEELDANDATVKAAYRAALEAAGQAASDSATAGVGIMSRIGNTLKKLGSWIGGKVSGLASWFSARTQAVGEKISGHPIAAITAAIVAAGGIGAAIVKFWRAAPAAVAANKGVIIPGKSSTSEIVKQLETLRTTVGGATSKIKGKPTAVAADKAGIMAALRKFKDSVTKTITDIWGAIRNGAKAFWGWIKNSDATKAAGGRIPAARAFLSKAWAATTSAIGGGLRSIWGWIVRQFERFTGLFKKKAADAATSKSTAVVKA